MVCPSSPHPEQGIIRLPRWLTSLQADRLSSTPNKARGIACSQAQRAPGLYNWHSHQVQHTMLHGDTPDVCEVLVSDDAKTLHGLPLAHGTLQMGSKCQAGGARRSLHVWTAGRGNVDACCVTGWCSQWHEWPPSCWRQIRRLCSPQHQKQGTWRHWRQHE